MTRGQSVSVCVCEVIPAGLRTEPQPLPRPYRYARMHTNTAHMRTDVPDGRSHGEAPEQGQTYEGLT
jgi:hypothetical protein